jgi:hypothetical protein
MAYEYTSTQTKISMEPAEDLSYDAFKFLAQVDNGTTGAQFQVVKGGAGARPVGVLAEDCSGTAYASVGITGALGYQFPAAIVVDGVTKVVVDDAYSPGTYLGSATGTVIGYGTQVARANARAFTLEGSTKAGDVVAAQLIM